ncbi:UNVERIFIED_ORG: uncharacterized protein (TIGR04255 family) [Rhizobium esperanzae]
MAQMKNAPIKYVIGVVRFPIVTDFENFAIQIERGVRDRYPAGKDADIAEIKLQIDEKGVQVQTDETKVWQYRSEDFKWAVIVNKNLVGIHTIGYVDHSDFIERLLHVAEVAATTEGGQVQLVESVALRYLDLIEPREGESLAQYIDEKVLPEAIDVPGVRIKEGVTHLQMETDQGSFLRVTIGRKPPTVYPADLGSQLVIDNGWHLERPLGDFAIIDADHAKVFSPPVRIDKGVLRDNIFALRNPIRDVFDRITTEYALKVWQ